MCYEQHTQNHILALKFHEVHFGSQITTPIFSSQPQITFSITLVNSDKEIETSSYSQIKILHSV